LIWWLLTYESGRVASFSTSLLDGNEKAVGAIDGRRVAEVTTEVLYFDEESKGCDSGINACLKEVPV
jgi:hypothetical protein